jgi:hypothetical protein
MLSGIHLAHRVQLLRGLHPTVHKLNSPRFQCDLRGGIDDEFNGVDFVANTAILFTVSYFSTALSLALGADDLLASGISFVFLIATRYLHTLHRAAYGVAGKLLSVVAACRKFIFRPSTTDHPAPTPAPTGMDRADYRDFYWNGHWLPI